MIHNPENVKQMTEIYVLVSVDKNDMEGIVSVKTPDGVIMGAMGSNLEIIRAMKEICLRQMPGTGKTLRILKFSQREVIQDE